MYPDPILMLALFAAGALLLAAVFWPRRGLWARLSRLSRESERVRLEDSLKHLLDCERAGQTCTLEALAGRMETTRGLASDVLTRLTDRGLAVVGSGGYELTETGRQYALRILRTHRLWERYLADRTGVPPAEWHMEAERVEHLLSEEEADALAHRLGDPRYDPHGDPIPTSVGDIPDRITTTLRGLSPGDSAVVRHLEDEPREVFDRLLGMGLVPGQTLEVVESSEDGGGAGRIRVRVRGEEHVLRPVDVANVTVQRLPEGQEASGHSRTLDDVARGETVRVTGIAPACQGPQRRRLLDLGVVPGTTITAELVSTSGDPVAYRIRSALIALRREQARWIEIEADAVEKAS